MFKKLKDKIAEEVKQSPLKLQASVQQLTQAITSSPTLNLSEPTNELFSTTDETEAISLSGQDDTEFTNVDLKTITPIKNRRFSSSSSVASEFFPIYEFPHSKHNLQVDLESTSEHDDTSSVQVDNITKESLYNSYRKMQQRYNKYKGRYADLLKYYKDLERDNNKAKNILTETQDKAIRRIAELKEQCNLEQKAKAHLEESLRADLEERDHIINTLNSKIGWLKNTNEDVSSASKYDNVNVAADSQRCNSLIDFSGNSHDITEKHPVSSNDALRENEMLKEKLRQYEGYLNKAKEALTQKNHKIQELQSKSNHDKLNYEEKLSLLNEKLASSEKDIQSLRESVCSMRSTEDEAALSLAENKKTIHKELEEKEERIKFLENCLHEIKTHNEELQHQVISFETVTNENLNGTGRLELNTNIGMDTESTEEEQAIVQNISDSLLFTNSNHPKDVILVDKMCETYGECNSLSDKNIIEELSNKLEIAENNLQLEKAMIEKLNLRLDETEKALKQSTINKDELWTTKESHINELKTTVQELTNELTTLQSVHDEIEGYRNQIKNLQKELREKNNVEALLAECNLDIAEYKDMIKKLEFSLSKKHKEHNNYKMEKEEHLSNLGKCIETYKEKCDDLEQELCNVKDDLKEKSILIDNFKSEIKKYCQQIEDSQVILRLKDEELKIWCEQKEKLVKRIEECESEIVSKSEEIITANLGFAQKYNNLLDENKFHIEQENMLKSEVENWKQKLNFVENELNNQLKLVDFSRNYEEQIESKDKLISGLTDRISNMELKNQRLVEVIDKTFFVVRYLKNNFSLLRTNVSSELQEIKQNCNEICNKYNNLNFVIEETCAENDEKQIINQRLETSLVELKLLKNEVKIKEDLLNEYVNKIKENEGKLQEINVLELKQNELQKRFDNKNLENEKLREIIEEINQRLEKSLDEVKLLKNEAKIKEDLLNEYVNKIKENEGILQDMNVLELKQNELQKMFHNKNLENEKLRETIEEINKRLEKSLDEVKLLKNEAKIKEDLLNEYVNKIKENEGILQDMNVLELKHNELQKMFDNKNLENEKLRETIEEINQRLGNSSDEVKLLKNEAETKEDLLNECVIKIKKYEDKLQEMNLLVLEKNDILHDKSLENAELLKTVNYNKQLIQNSENLYNSQISGLQNDIEEYKLSTENMKTENKKLLDELLLYKNNSVPDNVGINTTGTLLTNFRETIFNLKVDYQTLQHNCKHDLMLIQEFLNYYKTEIQKTAEEQKHVLYDSENNFKDIQRKNGVLQNENNSLKNDKKELLIKVNDLSNLLNKMEKQFCTIDEKEKEFDIRIQTVEEEHSVQIKQIIYNFENQLKERDEELEKLGNQTCTNNVQGETDANQELSRIIKNMQEDIMERSIAFEKLLEEHNLYKQEVENEKEQITLKYLNELKDLDKKWRQCLDNRMTENEEMHRAEINELTKEWFNERKIVGEYCNETTTPKLQELEDMTKNSITGNGTTDSLHKQITTLSQELYESKKRHRKEINDLQRLLKIPKDNKFLTDDDISLEDCTEMEYLRNILYEYMMGKESLVLAKVLSAVVKFDEDQTRKIIEREEHKQSLSHVSVARSETYSINQASRRPLTEKELKIIAENLSDIDEDIIDSESGSEKEEEIIDENCYNSESEQSLDQFSEEADYSLEPNENERFFIGKNEETIWKSTPIDQGTKTRTKNILKFLPGPNGAAKNVSNELDTFLLFVTRDMVDHVLCTNIYIANKRINFARDRDCKSTSVEEILALFGALFIISAKKGHHVNVRELWAKDGTGMILLRAIFSYKRFSFLLHALHFDDITTRKEREESDKIAAIRTIFDGFVRNCMDNYTLGEFITIDEMLHPFRGRCGFVQYMPQKPAKYGLKLYALCDSKTCYTWKLELYCGLQREGPFKTSNKPFDIVKRLEPIKNSKRNLTTDNYYTSYELAEYLLENGITLTGTLKKNKRELPIEFLPCKSRMVGSSLFGFQPDITLVSYVTRIEL